MAKNTKVDVPITDGKDDTTFVDEIKKKQDEMAGQQPESKNQPNEGTDGSNFNDFLKSGDLARGQDSNDLSDKQKGVLVERQLAFETQQADQAKAAEGKQDSAVGSPEAPSEQGNAGQGNDSSAQIVELLTKMLQTLDAISENIADIASKTTGNGSSVKLMSK